MSAVCEDPKIPPVYLYNTDSHRLPYEGTTLLLSYRQQNFIGLCLKLRQGQGLCQNGTNVWDLKSYKWWTLSCHVLHISYAKRRLPPRRQNSDACAFQPPINSRASYFPYCRSTSKTSLIWEKNPLVPEKEVPERAKKSTRTLIWPVCWSFSSTITESSR